MRIGSGFDAHRFGDGGGGGWTGVGGVGRLSVSVLCAYSGPDDD